MTYSRKKRATLVALIFICAPYGALADCYIDYKAKQASDGLRLHYGVMQLPDQACNNPTRATEVIKARLEKGGWQLLRMLSTFGENELSVRQADAGEFFLKY